MRHHPEPIYPVSLAGVRASGLVTLHAIVDESGHVRLLKELAGTANFQPAVRDAVSHWSFEPKQIAGHPVSFELPLSFTFRNGSSGVLPVDLKLPSAPLPSGTPSLHTSLQNTTPVH